MPIPQWSFSKIQVFEQCKFRAYLMHDQKIPEPERELPPGKTEHANDRGTRIHTAAELFVKGEGEFIREMQHFRTEFDRLQMLYNAGKVSLEGEWAMDREWNPIEWRSKDAWLRLKLDALVFLSETEAIAVDYKSGKRFGNEIKHADQVQLYQLVTFLRYPKLETVTTELWYLDVNELATMTFRRQQGLRFMNKFNKRGDAITTCTEFLPNPNVYTCKYCMYGSWGTGHCTKGVKK